MNVKSPQRVLIVEDQLNWQQVLSDILECEGYLVQVASTPVEAIAHLDSFHFPVVVADMRLVDRTPYGLQGLEILRTAKQQGCKVVVLTGFVMRGLQERVTTIGADYFLQKESSFDVKAFRDLVASLMA